jgi:hypothetical protein
MKIIGTIKRHYVDILIEFFMFFYKYNIYFENLPFFVNSNSIFVVQMVNGVT